MSCSPTCYYEAETLSLCREIPPRRLVSIKGFFIIISLAILPFNFAFADEWRLKGTLGQQLQYSDNFSLSSRSQQSVFGYLFAPNLEASRKTQSLDLTLNGQGDIRRYDDDRWNCDNYNVGTSNSYRTARSIFAFKGNYAVACTYSQQILDTGRLVPINQSENLRFAPSWSWQWTTTTQLVLEPSYSKTSYANPTGNTSTATFSGNETYNLTVGGNHKWNQRLSLNGGVFVSNAQYTGTTSSRQNLYGIQVGENYAISREWSTTAGIGLRVIDTKLQSINDTSQQPTSLTLGYTGNISISHAGKDSQFSMGYSSALIPSAIGQTIQTQSLFGNYSYALTSKISLDATILASRNESVTGVSTGTASGTFRRDYFTVSPSLTWQLARLWQLKWSYAYRWQDYPQQTSASSLTAGTAQSNTVMLSLQYAWTGIAESR